MGRFKDGAWDLPEGQNGRISTWQAVEIAVLMDIRDELKTLNTLLHCSNFTGIPATLRSIRRAIPAKPKAKK